MSKLKIISSTIITIVIVWFCKATYRVITKELVNPAITEDTSNMRSINTALLGYYAANNCKYPDSLQQLVDTGLMEQEDIKLRKLNIHYVKDFDAGDGDHIIMFTSTYPSEDEYNGDYGVVSYVDGSCIKVKRHELEKLLAQEIEKLRAVQLPTNDIKILKE